MMFQPGKVVTSTLAPPDPHPERIKRKVGVEPVSYTHLDVYKRQEPGVCPVWVEEVTDRPGLLREFFD